jgi:hypothetical protein
MMKKYLSLPIRRIPLGKFPLDRDVTITTKHLMKPSQTKLKQASFAFVRYCGTFSSRGEGKKREGDYVGVSLKRENFQGK